MLNKTHPDFSNKKKPPYKKMAKSHLTRPIFQKNTFFLQKSTLEKKHLSEQNPILKKTTFTKHRSIQKLLFFLKKKKNMKNNPLMIKQPTKKLTHAKKEETPMRNNTPLKNVKKKDNRFRFSKKTTNFFYKNTS